MKIQWTAEKLKAFRKAYQEAVKAGADQDKTFSHMDAIKEIQ